MENINTWTLLHHDLARASSRQFVSVEQKAEALLAVLENHRVHTTLEEVQLVIEEFASLIEKGVCGKSLMSMLVDNFKK